MIPLTKYLIVKAIASLYHGEVPKPKPDDSQLVVNFSNVDDKLHFIEAWKIVKEEDERSMKILGILNVTLTKNDHGLQATIDVNTIWT